MTGITVFVDSSSLKEGRVFDVIPDAYLSWNSVSFARKHLQEEEEQLLKLELVTPRA
jgi:hypothetical protein